MTDLQMLVAVTDPAGEPLHQAGPDDNTYPVLKRAPASPLTVRIQATIETTFLTQLLRLDRYARQCVLREWAADGRQETEAFRALSGPIYLFLSAEEGGYARQGFWLQDHGGERQFCPALYINTVVDESRLETGFFEGTFAHELAHTTLRVLVGDITRGPSRNPHQSMTVTDYPTALDEGWAELAELLIRDHTANPWLLGQKRGRVADLTACWINAVDGALRQDGTRRNLFVHEKALPEAAWLPSPDRYQVWLEHQNSGLFLVDRLQPAQAMLSSEGVGATLIYRLVTSEALRHRYLDPGFYVRFLPPGSTTLAANPAHQISPLENVMLKLFAALRQMARTPLLPSRPLLLELVQTYAALFPAEAEAVYQLFLETTWGATVCREVAATREALAHEGSIGNIEAFQGGLGDMVKAMDGLVQDLLAGRVALDANVGPELWLLNQHCPIPGSFLRPERTLALSLNLNTASVSDLLTIEGVDLPLARRIVAARRQLGFFRSLDDLLGIEGITVPLLESLRLMQTAMRTAGDFARS